MGVLAAVHSSALTVAGALSVVAPADVTPEDVKPKRRQIPRRTVVKADVARRVKVVTVSHFPGPGVGPVGGKR